MQKQRYARDVVIISDIQSRLRQRVAHYMAKKMEELGGAFVQAESEVAAINMVYGAASAGKRVMTSSSSPGISLKQEGISYSACAELPMVIIDIVRCGPGLGGILPAQCDYFQIVKGGGHGDLQFDRIRTVECTGAL